MLLVCVLCFFFFNDTATTEIYTLSLHDALPIFDHRSRTRDDSLAVEASRLRHRMRGQVASRTGRGPSGLERRNQTGSVGNRFRLRLHHAGNWPCVFVENHRVAGLDPADPIQVSYGSQVGNEPTGREHPELLKVKPSHGHDNTIVNGISRIGFMSGGKSARWVDEDIADTRSEERR